MSKKITHEEVVRRLNNIELLEEYKGSVREKHKFKCPLCNKGFIARLDSVLCGHTKSCRCQPSIGTRTGTKNISGKYINQVLVNALKRKISFEVSKEYIENLLLIQNFKCSLSGLIIQVGYNQEVTASLDRIDSSKGYIEGNVQWVHKKINVMKGSLSDEEFYNFCCFVFKNKNG